jgi:CheY-like chemotaxis protein
MIKAMIRLQEYQAGEIVLPEGELGKGFCILESGTLEVIRDDRIISEIEMKGAIFGELSEILGMKRDAIIRAKTSASVRHVEESIADIVSKNPKVAIKLIRTLGRRLFRMNKIALKGDAENNIFRTASNSEAEQTADNRIKILIVEDKPNITKQLTDIFSSNNWIVDAVASESEALSACNQKSFSAILISLSLENGSAIDLRRKLKTHNNVLNTPVLALIVQGDDAARKKALDSGFIDCLYKPIDATKTNAVMFEALKLDSSARYFSTADDYVLFKVPAELTPFVISDIKENMDQRIKNTINEGIVKLIIDVSSQSEPEEEAIEVVGEFAEKIEDMKLPMRGAIIALGENAEMWNNLDGCESWVVCENLEEAKESLNRELQGEEEE